MPAEHAVQTMEVVALFTIAYFPAGQPVQVEAPVNIALYLPAMHAVQPSDVKPSIKLP